MKKVSTNRRTGRKGQHKSLLQETRVFFGDEDSLEDFLAWASSPEKFPDVDSLIDFEVEFAKSFLRDHEIPIDDTDQVNLTSLAQKYDHIPGVQPAVRMLHELARYRVAAERGDIESACKCLLYSGQCSRQVQFAKMEPQYRAGASRTSGAHIAQKEKGRDTRQACKEHYIKIYNELEAKGRKPASKREIYRRIAKEADISFNSVEHYLKKDKSLPS